MAEANHDYSFAEYLLIAFKFLSKHLLGLLSIIFGVVTKVYIIRKEWKRISRWQCFMGVFIAGLAGTISYLLVQDMDIGNTQKAIIVGFTPICVEPIITRTLIWINPLIDSIGKAFQRNIDKNKE